MKSLRRVLFFRYALAVTLVITVIAVVLIFPLRHQLLNERKEHLKIEAQNLAALLVPYFEEQESGAISDVVVGLPFAEEERVTIIDADGLVLEDSKADAETMEKHADRPEVASALEGVEMVTLRRSNTLERDFVYAAAPIEVGDEVVGVVRVSTERSNITPAIMQAWFIMVAGLVLLLLILMAMTFWTQRAVSSDLKEIGNGLEKIVLENNLDRMPQPRLEELQDLAHDLDTIANRVNANYRLLADQRDRLEAILVNISAGIIVFNRQGTVELINPAAEKLLGVEKERAVGKTLAEIHPARAVDRAVEKAFEGEDVSEEVEMSIPRKRTVKILAGSIGSGSQERAGVICVLDDVTETRSLERTRKDFVANVSHELRTPVSNLRATIDALKQGALEEEELASRFIDSLDLESIRLMRIIEDLLALSRLEAEEFSLSEGTFSMVDLLSEVVDEKQELAGRHGVGIAFEEPGDEFLVAGDWKLLKTACVNLIDNAIKYNVSGGRVNVALSRHGGTVEVVIEDTGIGIPKKDHSRVFERFYRVDRARSRETGGTGLGLSIVKHVMELHGGSVSLESDEGFGSTFTLRLKLE